MNGKRIKNAPPLSVFGAVFESQKKEKPALHKCFTGSFEAIQCESGLSHFIDGNGLRLYHFCFRLSGEKGKISAGLLLLSRASLGRISVLVTSFIRQEVRGKSVTRTQKVTDFFY